MPRLSVDIDLNYVGSGDRAAMLADKPKVEQAIQAVCAREGLIVKRMPGEHAGGKWRLSFVNTAGSSDKLEVDVNFMLRLPLWPVITLDSQTLGPAVAKEIVVVDRHELAAGKLAALYSRNASRDIFDARELLRRDDIDRGKCSPSRRTSASSSSGSTAPGTSRPTTTSMGSAGNSERRRATMGSAESVGLCTPNTI